MPIDWSDFEPVSQPGQTNSSTVDWSQFEPVTESPSKVLAPYRPALISAFDDLGLSALAASGEPPPTLGLERVKVPTGKTPLGVVGSAAAKTGLGLAATLTDPEMVGEAVGTMTPAAPAIYTKWAFDMLNSGVQSLKEVKENLANLIGEHITQGFSSGQGVPTPVEDPKRHQEMVQDLADNALNAAVSIPGALGAGKGAVSSTLKTKGIYASEVPETAEIHGDVRTQPQQSQGEMPIEGGGPRVRPEAETVAEEGKVLLTKEQQERAAKLRNKISGFQDLLKEATLPEEKKSIQSKIDSLEQELNRAEGKQAAPALTDKELEFINSEKQFDDRDVQVMEPSVPSENEPFAKRQRPFMRANRKTQKIEIYPDEFREWLASIDPQKRRQAVRARLWEERFHLDISDSAAATYWSTLTRLEKAIERYVYTGERTPEGQARFGMNDTLWGNEALRRRMQQLAEMEPSEIAETAGRERWTLKGLSVLETAVRGIRENLLRTKASQEGLAILDRVQTGIDSAKKAIALRQPAPKSPQDVLEDYAEQSGIYPNDPMAQKRRERHKAGEQPELFGTMTQRGVVGEEGSVAQRPSAVEAGATKPKTDAELKSEAKDYLSGTISRAQTGEPTTRLNEKGEVEFAADVTYDRPSWEGFLKQLGPYYKPERVRALWEDAVWQELMKASPERLSQWRAALGLDWFGAQRGTDLRKSLPGERPNPREIRSEIAPEKAVEQATAELTKKNLEELTKPGLTQEEISTAMREGKREMREVPEQARKRAIADRRYRSALQLAMAERLIRESTPETSPLDRSDVRVEDLAFDNAAVGEKAWRNLTNAEVGSPAKLLEIVKHEARRSNADSVTMTRRLLALRGPNKEVSLVAAYPHRGEVMVTEPTGATGKRGRPSVKLKDAMSRGWTPFVTGVLNDPVQGFVKNFKGITEFNDYLGDAATKLRDSIGDYEPPVEVAEENVPRGTSGEYPSPEGLSFDEIAADLYEAPISEIKARRSEALENLQAEGLSESRIAELEDVASGKTPPEVGRGVRGEGGTFIGPMAGALRSGIGEMRRIRPMSAREALSVKKLIHEDIGVTGDMMKDVGLIRDALRDMSENNELKARSWAALSALRKAAGQLLYESRVEAARMIQTLRKLDKKLTYEKAKEYAEKLVLSPEGAYAQAIAEFYRFATDKTQGAQYEYVARALERFGPAPEKAGRKSAASEFEKELTMRERRPPTDVRPATTPTEPPPLLSPGAVEPRTEEFLSPKDQRYVEEQVRTESLYEPTKPFEYPKSTGKGLKYGKLPFSVEATEKPSGTYYRRRLAQGPQQVEPMAQRRGTARERARAEFDSLVKRVAISSTRGQTRSDIYRLADGLESTANVEASGAGNTIRLASEVEVPERATRTQKRESKSEAAKVRQAVKAVVAAKFKPKDARGNKRGIRVVNPGKFDEFIAQVNLGIAKAQEWQQSRSPIKRIIGYKWEKSALQRLEELEYAKVHWKDPAMKAATDAYEKEMADHRQFMIDNGIDVRERENYIPGLYDGEVFSDGAFHIGSMRILGKQFRMPKKFKDPYVAIRKGPYMLVNGDVADLAQNSIVTGRRMVARRAFLENLKQYKDPNTHSPIAMNPDLAFKEELIEDPKTGETHFVRRPIPTSPNPNYDLVRSHPDALPIAVYHPYAKAVKAALAYESAVRVPFVGEFDLKPALMLSSALKHGVVLIWDTFHPARLLQYAIPLSGRSWLDAKSNFEGGYSALNFRMEDLDKAVNRGWISKGAADWAREPVYIRQETNLPGPGGGKEISTRATTRHQMGLDLVSKGLNASRIADALYRDAVRMVPILGEKWHKVLQPFNRLIFDKITSGLMLDVAVQNMERINQKHPEIPYSNLARDVVRDINARFGNMGRQGIFKNPTFRDLMQIFFLAPYWQEGLIQSEVRTLARAGAAPFRLVGRAMGGKVGAALEGMGGRSGLPIMGSLGRGMVRGLAAYFILTQVINLISRGRFTWDNPEDDHKMDAYIPVPGSGRGLWLSPLSVFAETTHSLMHLLTTKPDAWAAIEQFAANKLGPVGAMMNVMATGYTREGEKIVAGSRLGSAAGELLPGSISVGAPLRAVGHAVAPGLVSPNRPGVLAQRAAGSIGYKVNIEESAESQVFRKAQKFVKDYNLVPPSGWMEIRTDEPSYTKLRHYLRNEDDNGAMKILREMRKTHTDAAIFKAMNQWGKRGFTGSKTRENLFRHSLSDEELELYHKATLERMALISRFTDLYIKLRESE